MEEYTNKDKVELRKKQWDLAMQGDVRMLIWLGKQVLGQKDSPEQPMSNPIEGVVFVDDDGKKYLDI